MPRLKLKTKLVLAITGMVLALVLALSCIYVSQLIDQRLTEADANAAFIAHQVLEAARKALESRSRAGRADSADPAKLHEAIAAILQTDAGLNSLLQSVIGYSPTIYDVAIVDSAGRAMLHSDRGIGGQGAACAVRIPQSDSRRLFAPNRGHLRRADGLRGPLADSTRRRSVRRNPHRAVHGLSEERVAAYAQPCPDLFRRVGIDLAALAAGLSSRVLQPLEAIARRLDAMTVEVAPSEPESPRKTDEYGAVNTRIDRLGRKIRDVKEIFSALKENLDQIMGTLQDGLMLFTREENVVLVSASAERFAGRHRAEILGRRVDEIFDDSTRLGRIVLDSFALHQPISQREIEIENGRRDSAFA